MIEFKNLTKYYPTADGRRYILDDISIRIPSDNNIGILGANGAGKSTLLRLIGGAESANAGHIITEKTISWPLGLASGFQGSLTGRQNTQFVCRINGLTKQEVKEVSEFVLDFTELAGYYDMPVRSYSSGMRARLTFGLSMAFDFDVYLVDELTSVGDMGFRAKAADAFKKIKERSSLIFVSHNLKTLADSCESGLFLAEGKVFYYEDIKEGIQDYTKWMKQGIFPSKE